MEEQLVGRAFDISPETIYGYALGFLVLAIIALIYALIKKDGEVRKLNGDILALTTNMTNVVSTLHTILQNIKDAQVDAAEEIPSMIHELEKRLELHFKIQR